MDIFIRANISEMVSGKWRPFVSDSMFQFIDIGQSIKSP